MEVVVITIVILAMAQVAIGAMAIKKIRQLGCEHCNPDKKAAGKG